MKKVYYTLALAALLTAGCSQNDELSVIEQPNVKENALTATFDGVTRTYTTDGRNTLWSDNDIIYVGASTMGAFKLSSSGGSNTGVFLPDGNVSGELGDNFYAVYGPCTSSPTKDGNIVSGFTIPSEISYTDPNCKNVIMMGKVNKDQKTVSFKNTGAILYVKIGKNIDINTVKVVADYAISGDATVEWKVDDESHEEKPVYKITAAYSNGSNDNITVTDVSTTGEDNNVVIPLPQSSSAQTISVFVGNGDATKQIFTGSVKIERNKYYKIEYNSENDMIVNMEDGLISALNTASASHVTMVNNFSIVSDHTITPNENGIELDLNKKTLTIADGKKLVVNLGGGTRQTSDPVFKISNGTIDVNSNSEITCKVNQPCIIELDNCNFTAKGSGTFIINLEIPNGTLAGLKDNEGNDKGDYIELRYSDTKINGYPVKYGQLYVRTDLKEEGVQIINSSAHLGNQLILNFKRQGSSSN